MEAIKSVPAKVFDILKQFANSIDGIEKLGNIITAVAGLILLNNGTSPVWLQTLSETFSNYESFKNSFNWIRTGDGFFSNPYKFRDLTFSQKLMLVRRVCFLGVTTLGVMNYWNKLNKFTPPPVFPINFCLLLATAVLSTIISGIDLYDNSVKVNELKMKKIININPNDPLVDQEKLNAKMKANALRINKKKNSVAQKLKNNRKLLAKVVEGDIALASKTQEAKLNRAAIHWLRKIRAQKVDPSNYFGLQKQIKMLKLLKKPTLKNLQDVRTLYEMKDDAQFVAFKADKYKVRKENLTIERKEAWRSVAKEISNIAVFSLLIANAPYLSLIPVDFTHIFSVGSKCVSLVSGLIGAEKFFFENNNKKAEEPRASDWVIPLPVSSMRVKGAEV